MPRRLLWLPVGVVLTFLFCVPSAARSAGGHDKSHPHHLGLLAGWATESKEGRDDENGFALGLEYEYRFHEKWGVGAVLEALGQDTVRNWLLVFPVSLHPGGNWRLVAGPGIESTPKKDKFAFRFGVGYHIGIGGNWSLNPEAFLDLIETGENTWVLGLALGYAF